MSKSDALEALRRNAQGFIRGSSARVAYETAIQIVEQIDDNDHGDDNDPLDTA